MAAAPLIAILVPVLDRPHRAAVVAASIREAQTVDTQVVFVCTPGDDAEIAACLATDEMVVVTDWQGGQGDYARKINLGLHNTDAPYVFTGADDLTFTPGWDAAALACGARGAGVVGTVDQCNPRTRNARHSTHSLVRRDYAVEQGTVDAPGLIYHPGYFHNFCDDEAVATAIARGEYAPCRRSVVVHNHPMCGQQSDDVYRLGLAHFDDDRALFRARTSLWSRTRRVTRARGRVR